MKNIIKKIIPSDNWILAVIILLGIFTGIGFFTIHLSKPLSYLSDDPKTCVNCHIMTPQYASWFHSAHRMKTNCNDCHVPHDNVFNKYFFKAKDGLRHATLFTLRKERQVIKIGEDGKEVVLENCKRCHEYLFEGIRKIEKEEENEEESGERTCIDCHRETPHGRVSSLSSFPNAHVPLLKSPVPDWMKKTDKK